MYSTPKTNWVATDYFNISDYNRIKNNIQWIKDFSLELYATVLDYIVGTYAHNYLETDALAEIVKIEGASAQVVTVQGKNICPTSFTEWESGEYDGTTGAKLVNATRIRVGRKLAVMPSTQYYFNTNDTDTSYTIQFVIRAYGVDGAYLRNKGVITDGGTLTTGSDEYYLGVTLISAEGTTTYTVFQSDFTAGTIKPFICLNSESNKTYTAFVPNSPSSDYPSPALSAGDAPFDVVSCGKNLFPKTSKTAIEVTNGITFTPNTDGTLTINGTATADSFYYFFGTFGNTAILLNLNGTYTLKGTGNNSVSIFLGAPTTTITGATNTNATFTIAAAVTRTLIRVLSGATISNLTVYPQLELGSTSTPYESHKSNKLTNTEFLPSLPSGTKNTKEKINGVCNYVQRAVKVIFDGSVDEAWSAATTSTAGKSRFTLSAILPASKATINNTTVANMYCDKFKAVTPENTYNSINGITINTAGGFYIYLDQLSTLTLTQFKAWLALNPVTVIYELATPIYTPISDMYLTSYKGITNIFTTASVQTNLSIRYKTKYDTINMGSDATYADIPYADMINDLENNLVTINENTISIPLGEAKEFSDNGSFIDYIELNRLENSCLQLYNLINGQYYGRNKLSFKLNKKGVV